MPSTFIGGILPVAAVGPRRRESKLSSATMVRTPAEGLKDYLMNLIERITIEPGKCGGRPCIRGLRIRVKDVLGLLAAGASHQEILADYPDLEEADILAALSYAAEQSDHLILRAA